jgi:hypothetical protein
MAGGLSDSELNHILANREPYADATDLIAIRDEIAAIESRLSELTANSLKRMVNRSEIAALQARQGRYGTAEIVAREHVAASLIKTKTYETEMRLRAEATAKPAKPPEPSAPTSTARQAWRAREEAQRQRVPTLAGDEDDEE